MPELRPVFEPVRGGCLGERKARVHCGAQVPRRRVLADPTATTVPTMSPAADGRAAGDDDRTALSP
ncbi:hypothetical protein [Pseudonocardia sp.]|uniref:hypothetical protein n=1 Tax=Pseudonocardia sp. TaxID=60912 RepID=UPI0031FCCD68